MNKSPFLIFWKWIQARADAPGDNGPFWWPTSDNVSDVTPRQQVVTSSYLPPTRSPATLRFVSTELWQRSRTRPPVYFSFILRSSKELVILFGYFISLKQFLMITAGEEENKSSKMQKQKDPPGTGSSSFNSHLFSHVLQVSERRKFL